MDGASGVFSRKNRTLGGDCGAGIAGLLPLSKGDGHNASHSVDEQQTLLAEGQAYRARPSSAVPSAAYRSTNRNAHIIYTTIQLKTRPQREAKGDHGRKGNWLGHFASRAASWFRKQGKRLRSSQRVPTDTFATRPASTSNSLYTMIKAMLPSKADVHRPSEPRTGLEANTKSANMDAGKIQEPAKDAWKQDAERLLNGTYNRSDGTDFLRKYAPVSIIGQGSFGFVLRARRMRDGQVVAVKFIHRASINPSAWLFNCELGLVPSEVHYIQSLQHAGIVQFLDFFDDGKYCYLVTEMFGASWSPESNPALNPTRNPGLKLHKKSVAGKSDLTKGTKTAGGYESPCDLFECIEAHNYLPEATIHKMFVQLLDIVSYLAAQGVVHRDLKDENVVVNGEYVVKVIDFGSATAIPRMVSSLEEGWFDKFNGTLAFAPPEVIRGMRYKGTEAEVWTLGILLYTMAFRQSPFPDPQSILYGRLDFPYDEEVAGILDLIRKMLCKNPIQRIRLADLHKHPWVVNGPTANRPLASLPRLEASGDGVFMNPIY